MERECLYLKGSELYYSSWNSYFRAYKQENVSLNFKKHLLSPCYLQGVKLRDVFLFISKDLNFWQSLFEIDISLFIDQLKTEPNSEEDNFTKIEYLELSKTFMTEKMFNQNKKNSDINRPLLDFSGIGQVKNGKKWEKGQKISVEFVPVSDLAEYLVILNLKSRLDVLNKYRVVSKIPLLYQPNLIDIIYSIIWELSFYGPPEEKKNTLNSLRDSVSKAKNELK